MKDFKSIVLILLIFSLVIFFAAQIGLAQETWKERREEKWEKVKERIREKLIEKRRQETDKQGLIDYEKINIIGNASKFGCYDPSVEYDDKGIGWLAYTGGANEELHDIDTYLARTIDGEKTWNYAAHISRAKKTFIEYKGKNTEVVQRYETPSLLFDLNDPDENGRWKLFLVSGFSPGGRAKATVWNKVFIVIKKAKTPEELANAEETILFSSEELPRGYSAKYNVDDFSLHRKV